MHTNLGGYILSQFGYRYNPPMTPSYDPDDMTRPNENLDLTHPSAPGTRRGWSTHSTPVRNRKDPGAKGGRRFTFPM